MAFTRRSFLQAAGVGIAAFGFPVNVRAQTEPIRIGLMTVKTGPLASGGLYGPAPRQRLGWRISVIAIHQIFETHPLKGWWVF